jgi:hypothetical protein
MRATQYLDESVGLVLLRSDACRSFVFVVELLYYVLMLVDVLTARICTV